VTVRDSVHPCNSATLQIFTLKLSTALQPSTTSRTIPRAHDESTKLHEVGGQLRGVDLAERGYIRSTAGDSAECTS